MTDTRQLTVDVLVGTCDMTDVSMCVSANVLYVHCSVVFSVMMGWC